MKLWFLGQLAKARVSPSLIGDRAQQLLDQDLEQLSGSGEAGPCCRQFLSLYVAQEPLQVCEVRTTGCRASVLTVSLLLAGPAPSAWLPSVLASAVLR